MWVRLCCNPLHAASRSFPQHPAAPSVTVHSAGAGPAGLWRPGGSGTGTLRAGGGPQREPFVLTARGEDADRSSTEGGSALTAEPGRGFFLVSLEREPLQFTGTPGKIKLWGLWSSGGGSRALVPLGTWSLDNDFLQLSRFGLCDAALTFSGRILSAPSRRTDGGSRVQTAEAVGGDRHGRALLPEPVPGLGPESCRARCRSGGGARRAAGRGGSGEPVLDRSYGFRPHGKTCSLPQSLQSGSMETK